MVDELFPADSEACDCRLSASLYFGRRYRELDFGTTVGGTQLEVVPRGEQRPAMGIERIESEIEPSRPVDSEHSPARVVLDAVALTQGELDRAATARVQAEGRNGEVARVPPARCECRVGERAPHRHPVRGDRAAHSHRS